MQQRTQCPFGPRNERERVIRHLVETRDDTELFEDLFDNEVLLDDTRAILRELYTGDVFEAKHMLDQAIKAGIEFEADRRILQHDLPMDYLVAEAQ